MSTPTNSSAKSSHASSTISPKTPKPFRFAIALMHKGGREDWLDRVRRAEALGYDQICMADLPYFQPPMTTLAAAAAVTERIRLGPTVFNPYIWPPELMVRELAALDQMSGGRLEPGFGTGGWQFGNAAVIPGARADHVQCIIELIEAAARGEPPTAYFVEKKYPVPSAELFCEFVQKPLPIQIHGFGPRLIEIAAKHATTYGLHAQRRPTNDGPKHSLGILDLKAALHQVNTFRAAAGERADQVELSIGPYIAITNDRRGYVTKLQPVQAPHLTVDELLDSPKAAIGTVDEIVEHLDRSRRTVGISHLMIAESEMVSFVPIMQALRTL
jgi:probable F420-dependent oxidoreductase